MTTYDPDSEDDPSIDCPTPEQIREECAKIQAGWSPQVRARRKENQSPWEVPTVAVRYSGEMPE